MMVNLLKRAKLSQLNIYLFNDYFYKKIEFGRKILYSLHNKVLQHSSCALAINVATQSPKLSNLSNKNIVSMDRIEN